MLNVLFVYASLVVDDVNGKYYCNALNSFIERYKPLGNLTICVSRKECESSSQSPVDLERVSIRFVAKENTIRKRFIDRKQNRRAISELVDWADLVIGHVPSTVAEMALQYAMRLGKTCLAVAVGCPWDGLWNYSFKGKCMAPIEYVNMRKVMKKVPYAMYVTQEFLQRRYPCQGETIGCSNVEMPSLDEAALDRRLDKIKGMTGRTLKLATSAAVNVRYKGQYDVIKAMRLLRKRGIDIQYYLLGGGDNDYLRGVAMKNGEVENVHFLGMVSHEEVFSVLDDMDVYVQPSRTEGLPRAVVEAMGRALPAVGTFAGGIPELLPPKRLYAPGDVRALAGIIESLTPEVMKGDARRNFAKAGEYASDVLNARRNAFLEHVAQYAAAMQV